MRVRVRVSSTLSSDHERDERRHIYSMMTGRYLRAEQQKDTRIEITDGDVCGQHLSEHGPRQDAWCLVDVV